MTNNFKSVLAQEFIDYLRLLDNAGKKCDNYYYTLLALDSYMARVGVDVKGIDEPIVSDWLNDLTCTPQTKNRHISVIRGFAKYLSAMEIASFAPEHVREQTDFVAYTFSDEEFFKIIDIADNFEFYSGKTSETKVGFPIILRILYGCGLRVNEALRLRWNDIDLENGVITIKEAKNNKQRLVPMSASLSEIIRAYHKVGSDTDNQFLFKSPKTGDGCVISLTFRSWYQDVLKVAGISNIRRKPFEHLITPQGLRHYFTYKSFTQSASEGRTLEESMPYLSAYLGHNSLYETEHYLTKNYILYKDSQRRVNEYINDVFPEVRFE